MLDSYFKLTENNTTVKREVVAGVTTFLTMPLTFSIATGIGFGFISYAAIKIFSGKFRDLTIPVIIIAGLFLIKFVVD